MIVRTMASSPAVSVLLPAYNAVQQLGTAVESILAQTCRDFELIIVDDASTDGTWEIVETIAGSDSRIKGLRNESNQKIARTLNRAAAEARGRYIARMDADDWSYPERLQKQLEFMEAHPDVVLSGGTVEICDEELRPLNRRSYPLGDTEIRESIFFFSPFCHPAIICRADAFSEVGGYNESLEVAQDYDLYFRMGRIGKLANLGDCIHRLRTHRGSSSMRRGALQERNTLYIRVKAHVEYGYEMSRKARLYLVMQYLSSFFIPFRLKFWLFNLLRRSP